MVRLGWVAVLILGLLLLSCGGHDDVAVPTSVSDGVDEVVRQLLADSEADTAPGQLLELTRVITPAGESIAPHTHQGPQLAIVAEGTLSYTVIDGEATLTRATATEEQTVETHTSGDSFEIRAGDSIMEPTGMVHEASNDTDTSIVIYLSSLFPDGEPAASPVE